MREKSDYDDFFIASLDKAKEQMASVESVIIHVEKYLKEINE